MRPADHPANAGALRSLGQGEEPGAVTVARAGPEVDRWHLGAHPDVVERLWDVLNAALPADGRALVAGGPALVEWQSGRLVAAALGTQYAILTVERGLAAATAAGYDTTHEFRSVGRTLDLAAAFGPGWVFGEWDARELEWLAEAATAPNL